MEKINNNQSQHQTLKKLRILYPIWIVFGIFSIMYVPSKIIVLGNAAATASNILANETLFRMSIVGSLITQLIFIFAALYLYRLFESVNKNEAELMLILALVSVPIAMLNSLNLVAALLSTNNLELMMLFLNLNTQGIYIASIFWGLWLFPLGSLIYKSNYFPKTLGIIVIIAGFGYTLSSFTHLLMPNLKLLIQICDFLTIGEVIFLLWLVIKSAKLPSKS